MEIPILFSCLILQRNHCENVFNNTKSNIEYLLEIGILKQMKKAKSVAKIYAKYKFNRHSFDFTTQSKLCGTRNNKFLEAALNKIYIR